MSMLSYCHRCLSRSNRSARRLIGLVLGWLLVDHAVAQLRVVTYNISNYDGTTRAADLQTVFYATFEGRSLAPDIILAQEFSTPTAVNNFRNLLNSAVGSPGDWVSTGFATGGDTAQVALYRSSKVQFLQRVTVSPGGALHPRNLMRFDFRPVGYTGAGATLACYNTHMKAGSTGSDGTLRLNEARAARDNAETLNPAWSFLLGGDLNIQSSGEAAYVELTGPQASDAGRFFDPIATPGTWNNNVAYRFVHTQDPIGAGGMDDRYDQILMSDTLIDGDGLDYIGQAGTPYSTSTWNDSRHSYRSYGNDGASFDTTLRTTGNTMVGPVIAQALRNAAAGAGHLPVYVDLRVPAEIDSPLELDFGAVPVGAFATATLTVINSGDIALWTVNGIADLRYSLSASSGFAAPAGTFTEAPGGGGNDHVITMDTSAAGTLSGTLTIASNAPDQPSRLVALTGVVGGVGPVLGDMNCDGLVDFNDIDGFVIALVSRSTYEAAYPACRFDHADANRDGSVNFDDINAFVGCLVAGVCP